MNRTARTLTRALLPLVLASLVGCTKLEDLLGPVLIAGLTDKETVVAQNTGLAEQDIHGTNTDLLAVTSDLVLSSIGLNGSQISWSSIPAGIIAVGGTVTWPSSDTPVTLTATITKGGVTVVKSFEVTVIRKNDVMSVADDKAALVDSVIIGTNPDLSAVTSDLVLPSTGANGTSIAWTSNPTGMIASDGKITRPDGHDAAVILSASITRSGVTVIRDFALTLKATGTGGITVTLPAAPGAAALVFRNSGDEAITDFVTVKGTPFTVGTSFDAGTTYLWSIDGDTSSASTSSTCVIGTTVLGSHTLLLDIQSGGKYYSGRITYTVTLP